MLRFFHFELLRQKRGKFQLLLVGLLCAIIACSIYIHWIQQKALVESQYFWNEKNKELWLNQPDRHPHRVAHYGYVSIRTLSPLNFIDPGVEPYAGNYLFLEAHKQNSSSIQSSSISPLTLRLGFPSVANLFLFIWPLLIIFIGYSSFSHDWESGRMIWAASMGCRLKDLFYSKLLVLLFYTCLLLKVTFFVSTVLLWVNESLDFRLLIDLLLIILAFCFYSLIWISIVLLTSYYSRNSLQSLSRLLICWTILIVVLPKLSVELTKWKYPTPKRAVFDSIVDKDVHSVGDAHNPDGPYFSTFKKRVLEKYNVTKVENLPVNWNGIVMAEGERITSKIFQKHYQSLSNSFNSQDSFYNKFGYVTPYISFRNLILELTATDRLTSELFEVQAENFRYSLIQKLNSLHSHEINHKNDRSQKLSSTFWQEMTMFDHSTKRKTIDLSSLLSIAIWSIFIFIINYFFSRKEIL